MSAKLFRPSAAFVNCKPASERPGYKASPAPPLPESILLFRLVLGPSSVLSTPSPSTKQARRGGSFRSSGRRDGEGERRREEGGQGERRREEGGGGGRRREESGGRACVLHEDGRRGCHAPRHHQELLQAAPGDLRRHALGLHQEQGPPRQGVRRREDQLGVRQEEGGARGEGR